MMRWRVFGPKESGHGDQRIQRREHGQGQHEKQIADQDHGKKPQAVSWAPRQPDREDEGALRQRQVGLGLGALPVSTR